MEKGTRASGREVKDSLYEQFARVGKAVASPKRIEIVDLLGQGEKTVETIARSAGMAVTNTSAHLQVLRRAGLVATRREGTSIFYRLADDEVGRFYSSLRQLARVRLAEVDRVVHDWFEARDELEPLSREELLARVARGETVVIDVRPREEYLAGHIPGAISVPADQLPRRLAKLPKRKEVVAYCRGPYCVLAPEALTVLRKKGFKARRLEDGFPEWRLAGLPVAVGED